MLLRGLSNQKLPGNQWLLYCLLKEDGSPVISMSAHSIRRGDGEEEEQESRGVKERNEAFFNNSQQGRLVQFHKIATLQLQIALKT